MKLLPLSLLWSRLQGDPGFWWCMGHLEYLVDWEVYGPDDRSWLAQDDILDLALTASSH